MISRLIPIVELENVAMVQIMEYANLIHDFPPSALFHRLYSYIFYGLFFAALIHDAMLPSTYLFVDVIVVHF